MSEFTEALRSFFKTDKYVELSGIKIVDVNDEQAVVQAEINENHLNANGCVQGGMLYTIADFAFAVLGNYLHPSTVTQSGQITYLRPAFTKTLTATAVETERAGHCTISEVTVRGDKGETFCICHFNGFVKDVDKNEWIKKINEGK
ncbi:MAG: hotdog fold thioesterase [Clostridia bacterium]|nr:hotdog fold thioesterase [Clostridia bacterium]